MPSTSSTCKAASAITIVVLITPNRNPKGSKTFLRNSEPTGGRGVKKGYYDSSGIREGSAIGSSSPVCQYRDPGDMFSVKQRNHDIVQTYSKGGELLHGKLDALTRRQNFEIGVLGA